MIYEAGILYLKCHLIFPQVLGELTEKLERYSDIVRSTSSDKISLAYKSRLAVVAS